MKCLTYFTCSPIMSVLLIVIAPATSEYKIDYTEDVNIFPEYKRNIYNWSTIYIIILLHILTIVFRYV